MLMVSLHEQAIRANVLAIAAAVLSLVIADPRAWAEGDPKSPRPFADEPSRTGLLRSITGGFQQLVTADREALLAVGAAAAFAVSLSEDPQNMRQKLDGSFLDGGMDYADVYGSGFFMGGTAGALMLAGRFGHESLGAAGRDLMASLAVASATAWSLKIAMARRRPLGGPHSFPSGHTAVAFAAVPVAYRHGGQWLGLAATLLALGTGAARMEDERHYLSDVVFGATVGLAAGSAVTGGSIPLRGLWDRLSLSAQSLGMQFRF